MAAPTLALQRGIVKQALSGDTIIVRGQPKGGPPPERTVCLSNVVAPRLARRANPNIEGSVETKDEPYAWEAREFLRKKLIGKEVVFTVEYKAPGTGREYGCIYMGRDITAENITETMVAEGLVEVRRGGIKANDDGQQALVQLEDAAKAASKGKWAQGTGSDHIRDIKWSLENPRNFVDSTHNKPIEAVIDHVRDGCTVRAFLLPSFHHVTLMLSGIKAPMFKFKEGEDQVPDPFAEEAKFFTEARLLQRDVKIILEGVSNNNLLGTVLHPNGNIAELLLKEGLARCVDWSMGVVTQGIDKLRAAEKEAKTAKKRIWKDYTPSAQSTENQDKPYTAKVVEIVNGDALNIKLADGSVKKIFLASLRPPRPVADSPDSEAPKKPAGRSRPLYDVPYMFDAREFLRKKLIGKKVNIQVDYVQPPNQGYAEKTCCTVSLSGLNVAEALVSKGLATVIRYRQDDDKRSSHYDELLAAESRAEKKKVGLHSKKDSATLRVADVSGDVAKAKQFLPFLQRAGRSEALVEFVASGSRLRIYIPRETCLVTFLLSGIQCPRGARPAPGGNTVPSDPYGEEALTFIKEMVLQREVEIEVESMDKGGNFIGFMYLDNTNLSLSLVEEGLSAVHFTAERSNHYQKLLSAEEKAKAVKKNMWSNYEEPKETAAEVEEKTEIVERKVNYKTVLVTEITNELHFYAQTIETGPQLEKLMEQLRSELESNPPLAGSYTPKKGDLCAAKFTDGEWYRAKVEKVNKNNGVNLLYVDYGNREESNATNLAVLPGTFHGLAPQAQEYALACVMAPPDEEAKLDAVDTMFNDILNKQFSLNVEYRGTGFDYVTLSDPETKDDINESLISQGWVLAENRKEKRLQKLSSTYLKAQEKAKSSRLNLWRYGDFREDEAKEFGYKK